MPAYRKMTGMAIGAFYSKCRLLIKSLMVCNSSPAIYNPNEEKLQTVTYLRECFYGEDATTGRLQRVCQIIKMK